MDDLTINTLGSVTRIIYVSETNQLITDTIPAYKNGIVQLKGMKTAADALCVKLEWKTMGITKVGVAFKSDIAFNFSIAGMAISGLGDKIGDGKLSGMDSYTYTQLFETSKEQLSKSMTNILEVINLNKLPLEEFGITLPFISKLTAFKTDYDTTAFATKYAIDAHKVTKGLLDTLLGQMKGVISSQLDKPAAMFQLNNIEFYNLYKSARKVSHHHIHDKKPLPPDSLTGALALTALNKLTGLALINATLSVMSINYIGTTDINGEISNDKLLPGEYSGTLTCPGFTPVDFTFTIIKGEITELGFMMEAVI